MQKQKKQFVVVCVVLALCIALFLTIKYINRKEENADEGMPEETVVVTDVNTDDITSFSYNCNGEELVFTRSGDNWTYQGDETIDIDEDKVASMLAAASSITALTSITEYSDLSEYGLEPPGNTIVVTTAAGDTVLYLGDENAVLGETYLKTAASDTVYLISSMVADSFNVSVEDLKAETEVDIETVE